MLVNSVNRNNRDEKLLYIAVLNKIINMNKDNKDKGKSCKQHR